MTHHQTEQPLKALRWQARRGMLELDILLTRYIEDRFLDADENERVLFVQFLKENDQDLFRWLVKRESLINPAYAPLVDFMLSSPSAD